MEDKAKTVDGERSIAGRQRGTKSVLAVPSKETEGVERPRF